jgi:hypothetical protein
MADLLDVLDIDEAKQEISQPGTGAGNDDRLARWITWVSRRLDATCGPVVIREITDEQVDCPADPVFLRYSPLATVSSIDEYQSGSATALTAETLTVAGTYRVTGQGHYRHLERRSGFGSSWWSGPILVTYTAGRYADTASVDSQFKEAAGAMLRRLQAREGAAWQSANPFGEGATLGFFKVVEPVISEFLWDEMLPPGLA